MQYSVQGGTLPVVICELDSGEMMYSESGGRTWSRGDVETTTSSRGGVGKALGRMFSGESLFLSEYRARSRAQIAFASSFPGSIVAKEIRQGETIICQKRAFLAATSGVELSMHFKKKIGAGLFGGEGFIMQKVQGEGVAFFEIDGHAVEVNLQPGERLTCDTGVVALMDSTCSIDVEMVKGLKNMAFGGEGLFDTIITGPGKVVLQSMSIGSFANAIRPFISTGK